MSDQPIASRRTLLGGVLGATALGASLAAASGQSAAAVSVPSSPNHDFFLRLGSIQGDSSDKDHRGQIDILDWSVGVDNNPPAGGSGRRRSRPVPRPFTAIARSSIASPKLFEAAAQGQTFRDAEFFAVSRGERPQAYLTITLTNVMITSYAMAPDDTNATPTDVFELVYGSLVMSWRQQRADGSLDAAVVGGYDFERGGRV
ncbi:MAG: type VI secretion system tube protein Hcp [Marmoricola sp.]